MSDAQLEQGTSALAHLLRSGQRAGVGEDVARLVDRYRTPPAVDAAVMQADAEVLRSAATVMRAHLLAQEQAVARLGAAWSGDAADAALATLRRHLDLARGDCAAFLAAARILDESADFVREAMSIRSEFVGRVLGDRADIGAAWPPTVLASHVLACAAALTDLFTAVERIVDEVRRMVDRAVEETCARSETCPAPGVPVVPVPAAPAGPAQTAEPLAVAPPAAPEAPAPPAAPLPPAAPAPPAAPHPVGDDESGSGALGFGSGVGSRREHGGPADSADTAAGPAVDPDAGPAVDPDAGTGAELAGAGPL